MFISNGERLPAAFRSTGAGVLACGGLLVATLGIDRASLWFLLTGPRIALAACALILAFLPEVPVEEGER